MPRDRIIPSGRLPFIAPMKINLLKSAVFKTRCRCGVALLVFVISIWFALTPGAAQSKSQKRITSLQVGVISEGSRVTVVSDSALNDYEAFRRGDRFYVRIPLAEFSAGQPHFRGDGFDDVQVQKVGDSVVVSFKLQPGATARVDQRSNRLEVIFSAPNSMARGSRTNAESNRGTYIPADGIVRVRNPQVLQHRDRDTAGPIPPGSPGSPQVTRERVVVGKVVAGRVSDSQEPNSVRATNPRERSNKRAGNPAVNTSTSQSEASPSVSKREAASSASKTEPSLSLSKPEPSTTVVPSPPPGYSALATSTPAAPVVSQPVVKSNGSGVSQSGKRWSDIARQWISANRKVSLISVLVLLGILVLLGGLLFPRRKTGNRAKRADSPLAQPKPSPAVALNRPAAAATVNSPAFSIAPRDFVNEAPAGPKASELAPSAVPVASANGRRTDEIPEERGKQIPKPGMARSAAAAAPQAQARVPTTPSKGSSANEDQEREVFEL
jgi:hypothetical protein